MPWSLPNQRKTAQCNFSASNRRRGARKSTSGDLAWRFGAVVWPAAGMLADLVDALDAGKSEAEILPLITEASAKSADADGCAQSCRFMNPRGDRPPI